MLDIHILMVVWVLCFWSNHEEEYLLAIREPFMRRLPNVLHNIEKPYKDEQDLYT